MPNQYDAPGRDLILELDRKYPGHSSRGLARLVMREAPSLYCDYESARRMVVALRNGIPSVGLRRRPMSKSPFSGTTNPTEELPEGDDREWLPFIVNGPCKVLIISDLHIPYHDRAAVLLAIGEGYKQGVNTILLGGDAVDFYSLSRFVKNPKARDFPGEVEMIIDFIETLKERFPKARIIWKLGNHEERYETKNDVVCARAASKL